MLTTLALLLVGVVVGVFVAVGELSFVLWS